MRRVARLFLRLVIALVIFAVGSLLWAHYDIAREGGPLPRIEAWVGRPPDTDRPVRLAVINTASQPVPRRAVLDRGRDPHPDRPYVMSHPAFVLEWADGRLLLIDVGMTPDQARTFGRILAWAAGAGPLAAHRSVAEALGGAAKRVRGVLFTHLHTDHVGGIAALCAAAAHELPVFMTVAQAQRTNYTTRPGLVELRDAVCVQPFAVEGGTPMAVAGFPGVFVIDAGGHTPGSEIILATVGTGAARCYAFTGDIVNNLDGITYDVAKPWWYRTLIVPESAARQTELRQWLKRLQDEAGCTLLVSHDQLALERAGIAPWSE
ncbi:MAG: MBL fold metallo-hydrolase [Candidatus Binatia bacterium]